MEAYITEYNAITDSQGFVSAGADNFRIPKKILIAAGYTDGMSILDYGCGWGSLLTVIDPASYFGVDISPLMIAEARKRFPTRAFELSNAERLCPFQADIVVAHSVFTHIPVHLFPECARHIIQKLTPVGVGILDIFEGEDRSEGIMVSYSKDSWVNLWKDIGREVRYLGEQTRQSGLIHSYYAI